VAAVAEAQAEVAEPRARLRLPGEGGRGGRRAEGRRDDRVRPVGRREVANVRETNGMSSRNVTRFFQPNSPCRVVVRCSNRAPSAVRVSSFPK